MNGRLKAEDTPAVVVGAQGNGLGVVRSLASAGVPAIVVGDNLRDPAMWSRWCKRHLVERSFGRPLVDGLLKLQRTMPTRPVLILTDELSVNTVSEHRAELSAFYRLRLPSPTMVAALGDKELFQRFAEAQALPVPRTIVVKGESDLDQIAQLGSPVIIKPADKFLVHMGWIERLSVAQTIGDAAATCRRFLSLGETPVVQEWIDGPDSSIYFALFHCGQSPASRSIFFGRKIAANPPRVGSTALCVPAPEAADVLRPVTEKFLDASHYEGLGSLEYKWNPRDRRFVIIEPTVGRTDSQEEIATLNGLNLALVAYCYELGLPIPEHKQVDAVAWRESLRSMRIRSGLGSRTYDGYWRIDDPMPAFAYCIDLAIRAVRRLMRRLGPTTLPRRRHRPA
jgi:predicted ATP-grasp superfamily ATP-dependent carboligase